MICFSFQNISTFLSPISMIVREVPPAALKPQWFQSERDHHYTNYNVKVFGNRSFYISVCISLHYFPFIRRFSWGMTTSGFSHLNTTVCNYACTCVLAFIRIIYSGRTKSTDSSLTSVQWFFYFAPYSSNWSQHSGGHSALHWDKRYRFAPHVTQMMGNSITFTKY